MRLSFRQYLVLSTLCASGIVHAEPSVSMASSSVPAKPVSSAGIGFCVADVQRSLLQTEEGIRKQAELKKFFDGRQQELNRKQQELAKQKDEIDKKAATLPKETLQHLVEDVQRRMMELQKLFETYNRELDDRQKMVSDQLMSKMRPLVMEVAKEKGCVHVLDKQAVLLTSGADLTEDLIRKYNQLSVPQTQKKVSGAR